MLCIGATAARTLDGSTSSTIPDITSRFFLQNWQTDEGLPNNSVMSLCQTDDGFLWIGTLRGLVRFDGADFREFAPRNSPGLNSHRILALTKTNDGTLWIGTENGDVSSLSDHRFHPWPLAAGTSDVRVTSLAPDRSGRIWAVVAGRGIEAKESGSAPFVRVLASPPGAAVPDSIVTARDGSLWFNFPDHVSRMDGQAMADMAVQLAEPGKIAESAEGGVWLVTSSRISRCDGQGEHLVAANLAWPVGPGQITALLEDRKGSLWIGTIGRGLFRFQGGSLASVQLPHNHVRALLEDEEGNLWIGMEGGGLIRMRERSFFAHNTAAGLSRDVITALSVAPDGTVWLVPDDGRLYRGTNGVFQLAGNQPEPAAFKITCVFADAGGAVWVGTEHQGLYRVEGGLL